MPQPNMQQLLKQAQKMQQDMLEAQEALKNEVVEASAGGGMVTVKVTGDLMSSRSRSMPTPSTPTTSRCSRTWSWRRSTRGCAPPRSSPRLEARRDHRRARRPGLASSAALPAALPKSDAMYAPPVQRLITELSKLPGDRRPHRAAARVPHPRARRRGGARARRRDPRGQAADRPMRGLLQPRRGAALPRSAPTSGATASSSAWSRSPRT